MFPAGEKVPLDGVASDDWQELLRDDKHGGEINRISYGRGCGKSFWKKELRKEAVHGFEDLCKEQVTAGHDAAMKFFESWA